jgi:hypothetical protein
VSRAGNPVDREYRQKNRQYLNRQQARRNAKYAEIPAPRRGCPWTVAEYAVIRSNPQLSTLELACMLGRSYKSVLKARTALRHTAWRN